jgi:hypothetical protein
MLFGQVIFMVLLDNVYTELTTDIVCEDELGKVVDRYAAAAINKHCNTSIAKEDYLERRKHIVNLQLGMIRILKKRQE